ncbi:AP-5 complex subunit beta-1-like [Phalacrocorax carbo]|uniref:AP-5 complex subunit beta-1-like n=1 Tax=Phalacrocorax carbo TaxID=9209 RepID=UPI00311931D3
MAGPWGRLVAALGPPGDRGPPALRALRRPRPAPRHQTELLLLLLESPRELCGGGGRPLGGSPEWGGSVGEVGGALLSLLSLPPAPPPAPPRSLLLLATLTFLLAVGDLGGVAVFGALLVEGGVAEGAPAAAAECLREIRRARTPGCPPGRLGPLRRCCGGGIPGIQPWTLLEAEEGEDPADPHDDSGTDPGGSQHPVTPRPAPPSAFLLTPAAHAQLLRHRNGGGALGGAPPYATGDPAPLHATLLKGGGGFGGLPPPRLATLAQHPAFPLPLRLFYLLCLLEGGALKKGGGPPPAPPPPLHRRPFPGGGGPPRNLFTPFRSGGGILRSKRGGAK